MPKKKIAFVIGSFNPGGAERVISNLSNGLIDKYEIVIITFVKGTSFYPLDERIKHLACYDTIKPNITNSIYTSLKLNYNLTRRLHQIIKEESIDIVLAFITEANILAIIASKIYGIPCIISERNNPLEGNISKFWQVLKKLVYPLADHLVLQTQGVKALFERKIKSTKISILPNPIASELSKSRDNFTKKENLVLTVGRLDKNKNQHILIRAFSSIDVHNWKLLIIGEGDKKQELTELIYLLNLKDKVEIISKIKHIDFYYNKASIFVSTSITEGFPNALLEAMHFGLPCISTDCNFGPSDLINNGVNGFLIPVDQESSLKERLSQLMNDANLRQKFSNRAKLTTESYQSEKVIVQWEELISSKLKSSK